MWGDTGNAPDQSIVESSGFDAGLGNSDGLVAYENGPESGALLSLVSIKAPQ
jgi:hypothetical protein